MNSHPSGPESPAANEARSAQAKKNGATAAPIHSRELFGTGRQLVIEHSGHRYLLRITQNDKLILTK